MHAKHLLKAVAMVASVMVAGIIPAQSQNELPSVQWSDVAEWKQISGASVTLSANGQWMAYWYSPNKGDSELMLQHTTEDIKKSWPIGEAGGNARNAIQFNQTGTHLAFVVFPTEEEKEKASRNNQPKSTLKVVDLDDFEEKEFRNLRTFSFGGENYPDWLAVHLVTPETDNGDDAGRGTDMLLYDISSSHTYNIGNVSMYSFNKEGEWLAYIVDAFGKAGNGIFLRNMETGQTLAAENDEASYRSMRWTTEGDGLTALKLVEDEDWEDDIFHLIAFRGFDSHPDKIIFNPHEDGAFPEDMALSPNRQPSWSDDLSRLEFGIHFAERKEDEAEADTTDTDNGRGSAGGNRNDDEKPDVVIWHWQDSRLQSVQQRRRSSDENLSYVSVYHVEDAQFVQLADEDVRSVMIYPEGPYAIGYDNTAYELLSSLSGRTYRDLYKIDLRTGEKEMILEQWFNAGGTPVSPDGTYMLFYQEGDYHTYNLLNDEITNITENIPTSFINALSDINVEYPPTPSWGWTSDSDNVLLRDNHDVWLVRADGSGSENLTLDGAENDRVYQFRLRVDTENEKGIDLDKPLYMRIIDNETKETGIARINGGRPGPETLLYGDAMFMGLSKADEAEVYTYVRQTPQEAPEYYVVFNDALRNGRQLTKTYPEQEEFAWSPGQKLISYVSDKGDTLQAALYLPAGYQEGESYPTVVYIYERLTQNLFGYARPSFPGGGFNRSMYTSNGYAVLMPDIAYELNDPGMSAVWCVLPALDAAEETGIVDPDKVAIHGHSWGGYQTSFLITQTDRFKAAVAGAPLTNMISMYSLIYWNTGGTNQAIFESSQGRLTSGYWDNWDAYKRNSPVYFAQDVETPLLLMHNDEDGAVDFTQGVEYYNTLRRLEKPVIMLQYEGENHGLRKRANQIDYAVRMMEYLDHYLKGAEAPGWITEGVPLLEMEQHLEERPEVLNKK